MIVTVRKAPGDNGYWVRAGDTSVSGVRRSRAIEAAKGTVRRAGGGEVQVFDSPRSTRPDEAIQVFA